MADVAILPASRRRYACASRPLLDLYPSGVPRLVLYREAITKGPPRVVGGLKLPYRSMRSGWQPAWIQIDDGEPIRLVPMRRHIVEAAPGAHLTRACGKGFVSAEATIEVDHSGDLTVAITPDWLEADDPAFPRGQLKIRTVDDPHTLQPFKFYKEMPTSLGSKTLIFSLLLSLLASAALLGFGLAALAAIAFGFSVDPFVGVFCLMTAGFIASFAIPVGLAGILTAARFMRLPADWR